jgi:hypothetical protein
MPSEGAIARPKKNPRRGWGEEKVGKAEREEMKGAVRETTDR